MKTICVYCASNTGSRPEYSAAARETGALLASRGIRIVYGGGRAGLMGELADSAMAAGGEVIGVMPHSLVEREAAHQGLSQLIIVDTMHERKAMLSEMADGFMVLPGGIGTLEEFFEAWTWALLGVHSKPIGVLNVNGYWNSIVGFTDHMATEGFLRPHTAELFVVADTVTALLAQMESYAAPPLKRWVSKTAASD